MWRIVLYLILINRCGQWGVSPASVNSRWVVCITGCMLVCVCGPWAHLWILLERYSDFSHSVLMPVLMLSTWARALFWYFDNKLIKLCQSKVKHFDKSQLHSSRRSHYGYNFVMYQAVGTSARSRLRHYWHTVQADGTEAQYTEGDIRAEWSGCSTTWCWFSQSLRRPIWRADTWRRAAESGTDWWHCRRTDDIWYCRCTVWSSTRRILGEVLRQRDHLSKNGIPGSTSSFRARKVNSFVW